MNSNLNPVELIELRLLQQGRAQYSDGRDWIRMLIGILVTTAVFLTAFDLGCGKIATTAMLITGLAATVGWIMKAGEVAKSARVAELESRQSGLAL